MHPRRRLALALLTAAVLAVAGCSSGQGSRANVKVKGDRQVAPDFNLKDAQGRAVKLSDYKGKIVLLNFWATWCGPCKIEIPWFIDLEQRYKDRGFAVIGIATDEEGWEIVKPYIEKKKVNYRVAIASGDVTELYGGVESLPTTFVIDKEGRVASAHVGLVSKSVYVSEIEQLLQPEPPAPTKTSALTGPAGGGK
jgi:peroxiredoxin